MIVRVSLREFFTMGFSPHLDTRRPALSVGVDEEGLLIFTTPILIPFLPQLWARFKWPRLGRKRLAGYRSRVAVSRRT